MSRPGKEEECILSGWAWYDHSCEFITSRFRSQWLVHKAYKREWCKLIVKEVGDGLWRAWECDLMKIFHHDQCVCCNSS